MTIKRKLAEFSGWHGTIAIVLAFALVSFQMIPSNGLAFQLLNLSGAIGIIVISLVKGVRQSVVLNIFWAIIAMLALVKIALK